MAGFKSEWWPVFDRNAGRLHVGIRTRIKSGLKIYPYEPGSYGSSISGFLTGKGPLGQIAKPAPPQFVEGTGKVMNTIPPNDASYYDMLNALVQDEPADALDPEIAGQFAAIGIVKGKEFKPDERMRKILVEAAAVGNAASRTVGIAPKPELGFSYYPDSKSNWSNPLFAGGYDFMAPPPEVTKDGVKPYPVTGGRTLDGRTSFFYLATVITPAMVMRLTNVGSQYLGTFYDSNTKPLDGAKTYRLDLPKDIPAAKFWSVTLYDNQSDPCFKRGNLIRVRAVRPIRRRLRSRTPMAAPASTSRLQSRKM